MTVTQQTRRATAVKTADAINAIEGVPVSDYARSLSLRWMNGELTGEQMKASLLASHRKWRSSRRTMSDSYLYKDAAIEKSLDIAFRVNYN